MTTKKHTKCRKIKQLVAYKEIHKNVCGKDLEKKLNN